MEQEILEEGECHVAIETDNFMIDFMPSSVF